MSVSRPALAPDAAHEVRELLHEILSRGMLYGWSLPTSR
jgi:hypothetical protein